MGLVEVVPALEICESDTCEAMLATWESALVLYCPTVEAMPFCKVWIMSTYSPCIYRASDRSGSWTTASFRARSMPSVNCCTEPPVLIAAQAQIVVRVSAAKHRERGALVRVRHYCAAVTDDTWRVSLHAKAEVLRDD